MRVPFINDHETVNDTEIVNDHEIVKSIKDNIQNSCIGFFSLYNMHFFTSKKANIRFVAPSKAL